MSYIRLYDLLPEVALAESTIVELAEINAYNLPAGEYGLAEMYCDDDDCDCRRVLIAVMENKVDAQEPLAVISFDWESLDYYAKWFNMGKKTSYSELDYLDKQSVDSMHGIRLIDTSLQSKFAPAILDLLEKRVLNDEFYLNRLKAHYKQFREKIYKNRHNKSIV